MIDIHELIVYFLWRIEQFAKTLATKIAPILGSRRAVNYVIDHADHPLGGVFREHTL